MPVPVVVLSYSRLISETNNYLKEQGVVQNRNVLFIRQFTYVLKLSFSLLVKRCVRCVN
jgi:hypothetical protein